MPLKDSSLADRVAVASSRPLKSSWWICLVAWSATLSSLDLPAADRFVDDSFADFSQGQSDDGGHNLYVARDGSLRTINRFDLNSDGFLDVLFNCTHNTYQMLPATVGTVVAGRQGKTDDVPVEGSQQVAAGDLNRDGYTDLVFCPNAIGVHHDRRFVSIAWGGPEGWSPRRINSPLPIQAATRVEIVDLNADGLPDIAVLGGPRWLPNQPEGRIIRVYWGSATGFSAVDFRDLAVAEARTMAADDWDGDGHRDLAVLRGDQRVTIWWGTAVRTDASDPQSKEVALPFADGTCLAGGDVTGDQRPDLVVGRGVDSLGIVAAKPGRDWQSPSVIEAYAATQITIADWDADQRADLALTQFDQARAAGGEQAGAGQRARDQIRILWGSPNGYSRQQVTNLAVPLAVATAAGDLDADGRLDLAIAIHQGDTTFNGESTVWFGDGRRQLTPGPARFRSSGTLHVAVVPAERGLPARAVFCNSIGGNLDEAVPLHLFWGGPRGFDPHRLWKLPFHSGYESSAGDLNADGFVDLIVLNSGHAGEHSHADPTLGANILWGGPDGLEKSTRRSVLHEHFLGTSSIADLNRDGWLDLVLEPFGAERAGEKEKLFIYYGAADGFHEQQRVVLTLDGYAQEHLVADFNRDQWLDISVSSRSLDCVRILWGGPQGYAVDREQRLKIAGPVGVDAADFNGDGWLDLLSGSYNDPKSGYRDMGVVLFWGGPEGYRHWNSQWLPGFSPLGRTIADLDGDGHLDLVSPQHSGELTREDLACHIYWGSSDGFFTRRRTTFFSDSVNDTMAGDFNGDGRLDLAVNAHTRHGDHRTQSRIFYNDGKRFENPTIQKLPTNGPHLLWATDVGHLYSRKYQQAFESRPFTWTQAWTRASALVQADSPPGTKLLLQVRTAAEATQLPAQPWRDVAEGKAALTATDRALQYRAVLQSDNGDRYPRVDRVEWTLE